MRQYSAEAVTESVQVLADGNRIVTKSATRIFRDGEGRTRREQLNAAGTDVLSVTISDPVAGTTYVLEPASRIAYRHGLMFATRSHGVGGVRGGPAAAARSWQLRTADDSRPGRGKGIGARHIRSAPLPAWPASSVMAGGLLPLRIAEGSGQTTREELGQQTIEGVMASGTRSTTEIPAGAIGNEQPIEIVSEQWSSPELQVLVHDEAHRSAGRARRCIA